MYLTQVYNLNPEDLKKKSNAEINAFCKDTTMCKLFVNLPVVILSYHVQIIIIMKYLLSADL